MKLVKLGIATSLILLSVIHINNYAVANEQIDMTIDELIETATEQIDELNSFYKESKTSLKTNEMTTELIVKEWMKQEDSNTLLRYEIIHDANDIDIIVGDDNYAISFNDNENVAYEYYRPEKDLDNEDSVHAVNGYDDAHAVSIIESSLENYDVVINGIENLLEREAYHLIFEPKDTVNIENSFEMWVDAEFFIILKQHEIGERYEFLLEVTTLEPNQDIDDEMFELEIPDNVEVITSDNDES